MRSRLPVAAGCCKSDLCHRVYVHVAAFQVSRMIKKQGIPALVPETAAGGRFHNISANLGKGKAYNLQKHLVLLFGRPQEYRPARRLDDCSRWLWSASCADCLMLEVCTQRASPET